MRADYSVESCAHAAALSRCLPSSSSKATRSRRRHSQPGIDDGGVSSCCVCSPGSYSECSSTILSIINIIVINDLKRDRRELTDWERDPRVLCVLCMSVCVALHNNNVMGNIFVSV